MSKQAFLFVIGTLVFVFGQPVMGQQEPSQKGKDPKLTQATFMVTGLHCQPCTKTVETSLGKVDGIRAVKVDWKTKTAHVEFDETSLPAQRVSQLIAGTPHMMGPSMKYGGWLALKAPAIKDEASGRTAEKALLAVKGVKTAKAYPEQHTVAVSFEPKGRLTTQELVAALKQAGFDAASF
jgi:copper ion binding protein